MSLRESTLALYAVVMKSLVMLQVSRLLWDLLGDVCQPFYYGPLGLDHRTSTRRALKVCEQGTPAFYRSL